MVVGDLLGWQVRIPVPRRAGGTSHDPNRPALSPRWLSRYLGLPSHVELVAAEAAPECDDWFCSVEPQWYLNACMETSYGAIAPWVPVGHIGLEQYCERYRGLAQCLIPRRPTSPFGDDDPFLGLHVRRGDRGDPHDDSELGAILRRLSETCRSWCVTSDDPVTRARWLDFLDGLGCRTPPAQDFGAHDPAERLAEDFGLLARAAGVVSSVKGGWSAFPYAATRISGRPLLVTSQFRHARVWRLLTAYSRMPIKGVLFGSAGGDWLSEMLSRTSDRRHE